MDSEPEDRPAELADRFLRAFQGRQATAQIPVQPGPPRLALARLWGASVVDGGRTVVLHSGLRSVAVYDSTGSIEQVVDGSDGGETSFSSAMGLQTYGNGRAWVVDQQTGLVPLGSTSSGLLSLGEPIPVPGPYRDACILGEHLLVHVTGELGIEEVLRRYDLPREDGPPGLIAQPYRYSGALASSKVLQGRLACLDPDLVVLAFDNVPWIEAYGATDGALRWHAEIADLNSPRILEAKGTNGGMVQLRDPKGPSTHYLARVVGVGSGSIVAQYARLDNSFPRRERGQDYTVQSYLFDAMTGQGAYLGEDVPEILFSNASHIVLLHRGPDAHIELARLPIGMSENKGH